jgi:hypothetical protein
VTPYRPGALHHMPLRFARPRPCPRCGQDERLRGWNELCETCRTSEGRAVEVRARRKRENRRYRLKRKGA